MAAAKVFGIGFHKTGTTSLARALEIMGYRVTGPNNVQQENLAEVVYELAFDLVEQYDAFQDNPWPVLYKELDQRYPGSKFILTIRPTDAWIKSVVHSFGQRETAMRRWIYGAGAPAGNESTYRQRYEQHNWDVQAYFQDRPADLLVIDLTAGAGWAPLCHFLGKEIPSSPFPHANKSLPVSLAQRLWLKARSVLHGQELLHSQSISPPLFPAGGRSAKNILLLSISAGAGPVRAAQAIESTLKQLAPNWHIEHVDILQLEGAAGLKVRIDDEYRRIEQEPRLWKDDYDLFDRAPSEQRISWSHKLRLRWKWLQLDRLRRPLLPAFIATLQKKRWDAIISSATMVSHMLAEMKQAGTLPVPYFIVNTDFMIHRFDYLPLCDHYFLSTAAAAARLTALGLPPHKLTVTGIPIQPGFGQPQDRQRCRQQFNLTADRPVIVQLSGGFGMGSAIRVLEYLLKVELPLQVVVSAGRNQVLKKQLEQIAVPEKHAVQILGFTDKMVQLLTAADLVISKPGGLISSEILASGAALAIINPLPGPEMQNRTFLLKQGAAINIEQIELIPQRINQLLAEPEQLARLRQQAAESARPEAAFEIARFVQDWFNTKPIETETEH